MALMRYLSGIGLFILGLLILIIGLVASSITPSNSTGICAVTGVFGILFMLIGGFYARTAHQRVPTKVEIVSNQKADRYCPNCGRAIPFDAPLCPYCGRRF